MPTRPEVDAVDGRTSIWLHGINLPLNSHIPFQDGPLPESSRTLELLFKFLYYKPQPDLAELTFAVLPLAEASHKYRVYAAISSCKNVFRLLIPNEAAKQSVTFSAEELVR
ncbi:hypothetical protein ARMGADRAFT_1007603 [Armillaria gallica]|uniref:BTB domain-containing protein n=1 Tax=Armillaria gallica TaxID=47427 RepID=A0A2H3EF08_ARMGA|nr:hypothetical protein ARMGADRAFT_1007603 [Armillaria gallica]